MVCLCFFFLCFCLFFFFLFPVKKCACRRAGEVGGGARARWGTLRRSGAGGASSPSPCNSRAEPEGAEMLGSSGEKGGKGEQRGGGGGGQKRGSQGGLRVGGGLEPRAGVGAGPALPSPPAAVAPSAGGPASSSSAVLVPAPSCQARAGKGWGGTQGGSGGREGGGPRCREISTKPKPDLATKRR